MNGMDQHNQNSSAPAIAGRRLMTTRDYKRRMANPSEMKLWRDEQRGVGPKPVRINGRRFWLADEVHEYIDQLAATRHGHGDDEACGNEANQSLAGRTAATCTSEGAKGD